MRVPKGIQMAGQDPAVNPALAKAQFETKWRIAHEKEQELHNSRFEVNNADVHIICDGQPRLLEVILKHDGVEVEALCAYINQALKKAGEARSAMADELIKH